MPNLFTVSGYKVFFWSGENDEPIHVHVSKGRSSPNATKIWITRSGGCVLASNGSGIPNQELKELMDFMLHGRNISRQIRSGITAEYPDREKNFYYPAPTALHTLFCSCWKVFLLAEHIVDLRYGLYAVPLEPPSACRGGVFSAKKIKICAGRSEMPSRRIQTKSRAFSGLFFRTGASAKWYNTVRIRTVSKQERSVAQRLRTFWSVLTDCLTRNSPNTEIRKISLEHSKQPW